MDNNDVLIRLRYALDIKNSDMLEIFKLGGVELNQEELRKILIKSKDSYHDEARSHDEIEEEEENLSCDNNTLESFLEGFIIFKRGKKEIKPGEPERAKLTTNNSVNVNNMVLKKLKIALSLTSEDVQDILKEAGVIISKGELSALFRKEGHKNYVECGDKYARKFLKGLALKNRG